MTNSLLKLMSGDYLITMDADRIILSYLFPVGAVFHDVKVLLPQSGKPIRIRITDLNR